MDAGFIIQDFNFDFEFENKFFSNELFKVVQQLRSYASLFVQ